MTATTTTYAEQFIDEANTWEQDNSDELDEHYEPHGKLGYSQDLTDRYDAGDGDTWRYAFSDGSYMELSTGGTWGAGLLSEFGYGENGD